MTISLRPFGNIEAKIFRFSFQRAKKNFTFVRSLNSTNKQENFFDITGFPFEFLKLNVAFDRRHSTCSFENRQKTKFYSIERDDYDVELSDLNPLRDINLHRKSSDSWNSNDSLVGDESVAWNFIK